MNYIYISFIVVIIIIESENSPYHKSDIGYKYTNTNVPKPKLGWQNINQS